MTRRECMNRCSYGMWTIAPWAMLSLLLQMVAGLPRAMGQPATAQSPRPWQAILLTSKENAYNPIPSPDGKLIAYVGTGWRRNYPAVSFGRSNLESNVHLMDADGRKLTTERLADAFLQGWTPDGKRLVCFRDWNAFLVSPDGTKTHETNLQPNADVKTERAAYFANRDAILWAFNSGNTLTFQTSKGELLRRTHGGTDFGSYLVPSPDGRYIAQLSRNLWVYDMQTEKWVKLGELQVHPARDWGYYKPSWNPWFPDSSRLTFISNNRIIVCSPEGNERKVVARPPDKAGIPAASPNGEWVAYVTLAPRPKHLRPDLQFWGDSTLWVAPVDDSDQEPFALTSKAEESTFGLRWIDDEAVVFDRVKESTPGISGQIWKASVADFERRR